jgi:Rieske Fe-S protein
MSEQTVTDPRPSRRSVLAAGAVGAGALTLAACGSSGGDAGGGPTAAPSSSDGPMTLTALADVPVGEAISVPGPNGKAVIVGRPTETTAVAFSAICTHQGCTVASKGTMLKCPCHGSTYNALTGVNTGGPAPRPLAKIAVQVVNGEVVTT